MYDGDLTGAATPKGRRCGSAVVADLVSALAMRADEAQRETS